MRELLLLTLGGARYGVWRDSVDSPDGPREVHRLPLSPGWVAGMCVLQDRARALADLATCLGLTPPSGPSKQRFVLLSNRDERAGFAFAGVLDVVEVADQDVREAPAALRHPAVETFVRWAEGWVPMLDLAVLYDRRREQAAAPLAFEVVGSATESPPAEIIELRRVQIEGETFALDASGLLAKAVQFETVSPLAPAPPGLAGVAASDGRPLPVLSPARILRQGQGLDLKPRPEEVMLVCRGKGEGAEIGLWVEADHGVVTIPQGGVAPLPALLRSKCVTHAALLDGEILPLLSLAGLLAPAAALVLGEDEDEDEDEEQASASFTDRRFAARFAKTHIDVLEFSIGGVRYAVPETDMPVILDLLPVRKLPGLSPLFLGVAERDGELLPVVDLVPCLGLSPMAGRRMLLFDNGRSRVLVVAEAVLGSRRLSVEVQRRLPVALRHPVVHGCYLGDAAVNLILDIEALIVHYKEGASASLPALSVAAGQMLATDAPGGLPVAKAAPATAASSTASSPSSSSASSSRPPVEAQEVPEERAEPSLWSPVETVRATPSTADSGVGGDRGIMFPPSAGGAGARESTEQPAANAAPGEAKLPGGHTGGEAFALRVSGLAARRAHATSLKPSQPGGTTTTTSTSTSNDASEEPGGQPDATLSSVGAASDAGRRQGPTIEELAAEARRRSEPALAAGGPGTRRQSATVNEGAPESAGLSRPAAVASMRRDQTVPLRAAPQAAPHDGGPGAERGAAAPAHSKPAVGAAVSRQPSPPGQLERPETPPRARPAPIDATERERSAREPGEQSGTDALAPTTTPAELPAWPAAAKARREVDSRSPGSLAESDAAPGPGSGEPRSVPRRRHGAAAGFILFAIMFVLGWIWSQMPDRSPRPRSRLVGQVARSAVPAPASAPRTQPTPPLRLRPEPTLPSSGFRQASTPSTRPVVQETVSEPTVTLVLPRPQVVSPDLPESFEYEVAAGDTLWGIAERLTGDPFNYHVLADANEVANPDIIIVGQKLRITLEGSPR